MLGEVLVTLTSLIDVQDQQAEGEVESNGAVDIAAVNNYTAVVACLSIKEKEG